MDAVTAIVPDGVIITAGGFLHAACEGEPVCGGFIKWDQARMFPLLDAFEERDVERVAEWVKKTVFGWRTRAPQVCELCRRRILEEGTNA